MKRVVVSVAVVMFTVLSGAAPAGATASGIWRAQHVPRPPGHIAYLTSVSCLSAGSCVAVGTSFANGIEYTMAEHWDRAGWAIEPTPGLGGPQAGFDSVSCGSPASCTAVGGYDIPSRGEQVLVEHWDGTSWTRQSVPDPVKGVEPGLRSVSCPSATSCTAVGGYATPTLGPVPVAEHWNGTSWAVQHMPFVQNASGGLSGVSCPTTSSCVAVGNDDNGLFAERWNGSQWTFQEVPAPAGASVVSLNSVSCPQAQTCVAVGFTENSSQIAGSIVERANPAGWVLQKDAAPAHTLLSRVSCASAQSCTAVGENAADPALFHTGVAESWNGTSWAMQSLPVPQPNTQGAALFGVSCATSAACTAVGVYGHPGDRPLAYHKG